MNFKILKIALSTTISLIFLTIVTGCFNMPTPTSQLTGGYASSLMYDSFSCHKLSTELNSLSRRENQLVIAHEQRIKSSRIQAFWRGYGLGDGVEAAELSNVRGEREAVIKAMNAKQCK